MLQTILGLEKVLSGQLSEVYEGLNPPASDEELKDVENSLGLDIPDDLMTLYRWRNGQNPLTTGIFYGMRLMPIEEVSRDFLEMQAMEDEFPGTYNKSSSKNLFSFQHKPIYLPIFSDGSGNYLSMILNKDAKEYGYILTTGVDESNNTIVSYNLSDALSWLTKQLESGNYIYRNPYGDIGEFKMRRPESEGFLDSITYLDLPIK